MLLRKFSQTLRVTLALVVAMFSSGLLVPAVSVGALSTSPNTDCPAGTVFLEKYNWSGSSYALDDDSDGTTVSVSGNATSGTFTVTDSDYEVSHVIVSGGGDSKTDTYDPAVTSGSFNNTNLLNNGDQVPNISNLQLCGNVVVVDVCPDVVGVQTDEADCVVDVCPDVIGVQTSLNECDVCPNLAGTQSSIAECADSERVELCHATGNPDKYVFLSIDAEGAFNGHLGESHQGGRDIIPPFIYNGTEYSQNWNAEGQALYYSEKCADVEVVTPAEVQFLNPTCENPTGRVVITATEGVTYKVGDTVVTGTVSYPAGTSVTVTAEASDESYVLDEEADASWSHTFTAAPTGCVLGDNDVCPNIEGTQSVVPAGMIQNTMTGECFTPGGRGGVTPAAQVLGASTQALPETLPSTGGADSPLAIIIASILAYGAAYFLQGRRLLGRKEALSA